MKLTPMTPSGLARPSLRPPGPATVAHRCSTTAATSPAKARTRLTPPMRARAAVGALSEAQAAYLPNDLEFLYLFALPGGVSVALAWWLAKRETPFPDMQKGELRERRSQTPEEEEEVVLAPGDEDAAYDLGTWVSLPAGPVGATKSQRVLIPAGASGASLVSVSLDRPLGVVLEQAEGRGREVVVSEVLEGSNAFKQARLAKLSGQGSFVQAGDVLRAATTLQVLYPPGAIAGASPPVRTWAPFLADRMRLADVTERLQRGTAADGPVHLVLERRGAP